jgi:hypothetical protein
MNADKFIRTQQEIYNMKDFLNLLASPKAVRGRRMFWGVQMDNEQLKINRIIQYNTK